MASPSHDAIIQLGAELANEKNKAFDLWTHLPSYKAAQAAHGDHADNFQPTVADVLAEATLFISHGLNPTVEQRKEAGKLYLCPCGEDHSERPELAPEEMMNFLKIKTSELSGITLDWAVDAAICGKPSAVYLKPDGGLVFASDGIPLLGGIDDFSASWTKAGPLIARERITFSDQISSFAAGGFGKKTMHGPTHLIAAMRCYVASKLGDEIQVPNILVNKESDRCNELSENLK